MISSSRIRFVALMSCLWLLCSSSIVAQVRRARPAGPAKTAEPLQGPDEPVVYTPESSDAIAAVREWRDTTGQHSIKARMERLEQDATDAVTLAKEDGKSVKVPLAKLSEADRELIAAFAMENSKRVIAKAAQEFWMRRSVRRARTLKQTRRLPQRSSPSNATAGKSALNTRLPAPAKDDGREAIN